MHPSLYLLLNFFNYMYATVCIFKVGRYLTKKHGFIYPCAAHGPLSHVCTTRQKEFTGFTHRHVSSLSYHNNNTMCQRNRHDDYSSTTTVNNEDGNRWQAAEWRAEQAQMSHFDSFGYRCVFFSFSCIFFHY